MRVGEVLALSPSDVTLESGREGLLVRDPKNRYERLVILGPDVTPKTLIGFVNCYDKKSKRRLFEVLKGQGMQNNQPVTFLSDGGDSVRNLQLYLNPEAEHLLDWFHITMRLTVMRQSAKGLPVQSQAKFEKELKEQLEEEDWEAPQLNSARVEKNLESAKWQLWHGNVFMALQEINDLVIYLEGYAERDGVTKNY